jgi:hypothetical protein
MMWVGEGKGELRSLRAHGGVVVEAVEEKRALRPVGYSKSSTDKEGKHEKIKEKKLFNQYHGGWDARGLGGQRPIRLTVRSGGGGGKRGTERLLAPSLRASLSNCGGGRMVVAGQW